jgi:hypothetical protein
MSRDYIKLTLAHAHCTEDVNLLFSKNFGNNKGYACNKKGD